MEKTINAIRFLGMDAINKANSGHPGIVLGAAPMMYTLYTKQLRITPSNPTWFNRDRFVLAAGHGSAMLYATLHLAGYDVSMKDLQAFRQLNSKTPGHPEFGHTEGIDATSGPLGQGIAMAAGMAVAEAYLRATFNKEDFPVVDHYTFALCGDGDLQEGVTQEAMSLVGHMGLGRLIVLYDSNDIQLDGPTKWAVSEDVKQKYEAMNWHYQLVEDANDVDVINSAIEEAKKTTDKPSIIEVKSVIGFGSSKAGDSATHGAPLGADERNKMAEAFDYDSAAFEAPEEAYNDFLKNTKERGDLALQKWEALLSKYEKAYPELASQLHQLINQELAIDFDDVLKTLPIGTNEASRVSGGNAITKLSKATLALLGGSADLTKSTKAKGINGDFSALNPLGRNVNFGVREHAMAAMVNGITLHHLRGFTGGFFVFSDYMKPAMRMAAIMHLPSIFIFTHDSVAVGEDGPTHEPIEQLSMLRTTPNMNVIRPCDANETNYAYRYALETTDNPTVIVLSRQNLEVKVPISYEDFSRGGYIISDQADFEGILIATGSEVGLALDAQQALLEEGIKVRVVSIPSLNTFNNMDQAYKEKVLPASCQKRLVLEMAAPDLWYRYSNNVLGINRFGVSAPGEEAISYFGFTVENVVNTFKAI